MKIYIDPTAEYLPMEIAKRGFIRNRKNKGDYYRVLKLIKSGRLEARNYKIDSSGKPYWIVRGSAIIDYLNRYEPGRFEIIKVDEPSV